MKYISDEDKPTVIIFIGIVLIFTYSMFSYYKKHEQEVPSENTETQQEQVEEQKISELKNQCKNEYYKKIVDLMLDRYNPKLNSIIDEYYRKCDKLAPKDKNFVFSGINSFIGDDYYKNNDFNNAIVYYQKALKHRLKSSDKTLLDWDYRHIGDCYYNKGDLNTAKTYYVKSLSINKNLGILDLLAQTCFYLQQFNDATHYAQEGLKEIQHLRETTYTERPYFSELEEKFQTIINSSYQEPIMPALPPESVQSENPAPKLRGEDFETRTELSIHDDMNKILRN